MIRCLLFTYVLLAAPTFAEETNLLTPIMVRPEKVHLEMDFETLYGKDSGIGASFENYDLGIAANDKGTISIDNLTVWQAGEYLESWETTQQKLIDKN
jgi:hypothetical protein